MKKVISTVLVFLILFSFSACDKADEYIEYKNSAVTVYPVPEGAKKSSHYKCTVSGQDVELYGLGDDAYGILRFGSSADVTIDSDHVVNEVTVYPQNKVKKLSLKNSVIDFTVSKSGSYVVNLDDKSRIFLFFDEQIDKGALSEGGYFKQGVNKTNTKIEKSVLNSDKGVLNLKSDTEYYMEYGSVLDGKIVGDNVSNVRIIGGGSVTGGITLTGCDNIDVKSLTFTSSADISHCSNVRFENVKVIADTDALTFSSCTGSSFDGGFVKSTGDSVSIKNEPVTYDKDNLTDIDIEFDKSENITVSNCIIDSLEGNSLQIGRQTIGDSISNITFKDITVAENINGVALAINNFNNSDINKINFENIEIENAEPKSESNFLIDIKNMYSLEYSDAYASTPIGNIDNINFKNVNMLGGKKDIGISFCGYKETREQYPALIHKVNNIYFKDCNILDVKVTRSYYYMYVGSHVESLNFE